MTRSTTVLHVARQNSPSSRWRPCARYTPAVRKALLVFLFLILPVQFGWAAVAGYCQHERGDTLGHFGHHEHQHQPAASADDTVKHANIGSQADDPDCAFCHLGCAQPLASQATFVPALLNGVVARAVPPRFDAWLPSPIERPKWTHLA